MEGRKATYKILLYFYSFSEKFKNKIPLKMEWIIPFLTPFKRIKHEKQGNKIRNTFSKSVILKVYTENYKTSLKEIEDLKIER